MPKGFTMDYRIAIPTYKRAKTIQEKTLAYLERAKVNKDIIDVFVSDKEEYELYKGLDVNVLVGSIGCGGNRNYITNYYKENQKIVFMDDDLKTVSKYINKKKLSTEVRI